MIRAVAEISGWVALVALLAGIAWPYAARRKPRTALEPHFWVGYLLAPLALAHGWTTMKSGQARGANMLGTSMASLALFPLAAQVYLGRTLQRSRGEGRRQVMRLHLFVMFSIALLIALHLALVRW